MDFLVRRRADFIAKMQGTKSIRKFIIESLLICGVGLDLVANSFGVEPLAYKYASVRVHDFNALQVNAVRLKAT